METAVTLLLHPILASYVQMRCRYCRILLGKCRIFLLQWMVRLIKSCHICISACDLLEMGASQLTFDGDSDV